MKVLVWQFNQNNREVKQWKVVINNETESLRNRLKEMAQYKRVLRGRQSKIFEIIHKYIEKILTEGWRSKTKFRRSQKVKLQRA